MRMGCSSSSSSSRSQQLLMCSKLDHNDTPHNHGAATSRRCTRCNQGVCSAINVAGLKSKHHTRRVEHLTSQATVCQQCHRVEHSSNVLRTQHEFCLQCQPSLLCQQASHPTPCLTCTSVSLFSGSSSCCGVMPRDSFSLLVKAALSGARMVHVVFGARAEPTPAAYRAQQAQLTWVRGSGGSQQQLQRWMWCMLGLTAAQQPG
jgi:hypothetical protein